MSQIDTILGNLFHTFMGVVEDINDPEKMGRVRVRVFGIHSEQTVPNDATGKGIKPTDLPWSLVASPTTSASIHGIGWNHGLLPGSWVLGISRDGETFNDLIVTHSIPGKPEEKNPNPANPPVAFHGQDGKWPDKEFIDEPDYGRLARGSLEYNDDKWKPIPLIKRDARKRGIPTAGGGTWDELEDGYDAEYPHNRVYETPARHTLEFDDTPGAERISIWHGPKKTSIDLLPDGDVQIKTSGNSYEIVQKDKNIVAQGDVNITSYGSVKILSTGETYLQSLSTTTILATATVNIQAGGMVNIQAAGAITGIAAGPISLTSSTMIALTAPIISVSGATI